MNRKIVKVSLAGALLFSVAFMSISNKSISSNNYFLEKKKDDLTDVKCGDFEKNELEIGTFLNNFEKDQKKLDDNVNVDIENGKKDIDIDENKDKDKDKDKNLVEFATSGTNSDVNKGNFERRLGIWYYDETFGDYFLRVLGWAYNVLVNLFTIIGFCTFLYVLYWFILYLDCDFSEGLRVWIYGEDLLPEWSSEGSDPGDIDEWMRLYSDYPADIVRENWELRRSEYEQKKARNDRLRERERLRKMQKQEEESFEYDDSERSPLLSSFLSEDEKA